MYALELDSESGTSVRVWADVGYPLRSLSLLSHASLGSPLLVCTTRSNLIIVFDTAADQKVCNSSIPIRGLPINLHVIRRRCASYRFVIGLSMYVSVMLISMELQKSLYCYLNAKYLYMR